MPQSTLKQSEMCPCSAFTCKASKPSYFQVLKKQLQWEITQSWECNRNLGKLQCAMLKFTLCCYNVKWWIPRFKHLKSCVPWNLKIGLKLWLSHTHTQKGVLFICFLFSKPSYLGCIFMLFSLQFFIFLDENENSNFSKCFKDLRPEDLHQIPWDLQEKKKAHNGESFVAFPRLVGLLAD